MKYLIIVALCGLMLTACAHQKGDEENPVVTVSIAPQKYFIQRLIGDSLSINVMIPQGSDHASYAPSAAQIKKLSRSLAYIQMGHLGFEATWAKKLGGANEQMRWYDLSEGIDMIQGEHDHHGHDEGHVCTGGIDPHTWTSPREVKQIIKNLRNYLTELFPQHRELINTNYETFYNELDALDERLSQLADEQGHLSFMIFHPAYTYLARAYGFEQMTIEHDGKTPSPARLKNTIAAARKKSIKTIYIQQEFDQANAKVIAEEIGAEVVQVNPLSANWKKEMEHFISRLEQQ
ncbi:MULTISPECIES: metal ABC transporter solute-binding protein, Zn/Mn family [unclassified Carboxylicivirga]|uniref:metal ABC transporter solute-binding protein, Zn/Mn family n=1 Tax=Carboxylicivirga TaxID=1628153 RepID=UPI003D33E86F